MRGYCEQRLRKVSVCLLPLTIGARQQEVNLFLAFQQVVYLHPADKYPRLTHRPSQEQKGLYERALMAS